MNQKRKRRTIDVLAVRCLVVYYRCGTMPLTRYSSPCLRVSGVNHTRQLQQVPPQLLPRRPPGPCPEQRHLHLRWLPHLLHAGLHGRIPGYRHRECGQVRGGACLCRLPRGRGPHARCGGLVFTLLCHAPVSWDREPARVRSNNRDGHCGRVSYVVV